MQLCVCNQTLVSVTSHSKVHKIEFRSSLSTGLWWHFPGSVKYSSFVVIHFWTLHDLMTPYTCFFFFLRLQTRKETEMSLMYSSNQELSDYFWWHHCKNSDYAHLGGCNISKLHSGGITLAILAVNFSRQISWMVQLASRKCLTLADIGQRVHVHLWIFMNLSLT